MKVTKEAIYTSPFDATTSENEFESSELSDVSACAYCGTLVDDQVIKQDKPQEWDGEGLPPRDSKIQVYGFIYGSDEMKWFDSVAYAVIDGKVLAESTTHANEFELYSPRDCRPLKTEPTDLQCEVDMINAYLEQIDSNISDYDVQMFAQYVLDRLKESGND